MMSWLHPSDPTFLGWLGLSFAFYGGLTLASLALGALLERVRPTKIFAVPRGEHQTRQEVLGNVIFVAVATWATALFLQYGLIRFGEDSLLRIAGTLGVMFVGFAAYYYALHRALHWRRLIRFHRWHHDSRVTSALSGQSMSPVEALGWMGGYLALPALLSLVVPLSFEGLVLYLAYNVSGNIVGHVSVELFPPSRSLWQRSLLVGVITFHALHHARWTGHYGFGSSWADRLFNTEWADWVELHAKVAGGQPLQSLKERAQAGVVRVQPQGG